MSDDGHNPDDDHPYFLFSRQLFDTLLLEPKVNLKEQIPRFFDEYVFSLGDTAGRPRETDSPCRLSLTPRHQNCLRFTNWETLNE